MFDKDGDLAVAAERIAQPSRPDDFVTVIGTRRKRKSLVTARDIRRFAQAIGEPLPPPVDDDDSGVLAPPLFCQTLSYDELPVELLPPDGSPAELDVPVPAKRLVGGASEFKLHRRVRAGELLTVETELKDVQKKMGKSGVLYLLIIETRIADATGRPVSTETATYVKRP
ncbi:MAG: MaoC family dehydratase N-terminal domain-containing protein [Archangiaceae bacterium]|nr:MaoC family dehydratase N-terminal domain-containing protein [Archangiaceae bacterium]